MQNLFRTAVAVKAPSRAIKGTRKIGKRKRKRKC
jgi:hypothetical protein